MNPTNKPFMIDKRRVYEAYQEVQVQEGQAGVDGVTIEQFEKDLKGNLYKIWNRMSSGRTSRRRFALSPFRRRAAAKESWCSDRRRSRGADVVKQMIEPDLDKIFLADSYGYGPKNRRWMLLESRASGAGSMIGF